jgi:hypothetical protein
MDSKCLYTLTNKQKRKRVIQNKKNKKKEKRHAIKNEKIVLNRIQQLPNELIDTIYLFVTNKVKFHVSHYYDLYKKYIINYKFNDLNCIFSGYDKYEYCTYYRLSLPLQNMLYNLPLDKLKKYVFYGTPKLYFNTAFPFENNIWEYFHSNYTVFNKKISETKKDYIFEITDILSYYVTKVTDNQSYQSYNSEKYYLFKQNEAIVKNYILSILYIYKKYGEQQ